MPLHLTPQAAELLKRAVALADDLGHHYLGVEHLVLAALSRDEPAAARALQRAGLPAADFVRALRDEMAAYPQLPPSDNAIPLTPRLARILDTGAPEAPLDPAALFHASMDSSRAAPTRLAAALGGDPARLAAALADLLQAPPIAAADKRLRAKDSMTLAMRSRGMLQKLVEELRGLGYELVFDDAIIGWLLMREFDSEDQPDVIDRLFAEDLRPRLEAAMAEHPPGSVFCLTLGGDKIDLLVQGSPEA